MDMKTAINIVMDSLKETHKDLGTVLQIGLVVIDALRDAGILTQSRDLTPGLTAEDQDVAATIYNKVIEANG